MGHQRPTAGSKLKNYILPVVLALGTFHANPVRSEGWYPNCVKSPTEINESNRALLQGKDCNETWGIATLDGIEGSVIKVSFRNGQNIKVFQEPDCTRVGPCKVKISINHGNWMHGIFAQNGETSYKCGDGYCNWRTFRDGYGKLILGIGMSY